MRSPIALSALALGLALLPVAAKADPLVASAFPFAPASAVSVEGGAITSPEAGVRAEDVVLHIGRWSVKGRFVEPDGPAHLPGITGLEPGAPRPGVLFVHWLGDPATTNLTEFTDEARRLARVGVYSLSVDTNWTQPNWFEKIRTPASDYDDSLAQVAQLHGALDALIARKGVDPSNIALVGHDFGAMYGAVLSGVDDRPRYFVFVAGTSSFADWFLLGPKPPDVAAYRARMVPLEPLQYLSASKGKDYLLQFSLHDEYIPLANARLFADAVPGPKTFALYDDGHSMHKTQAVDDRVNWLIERLALPQ